MTRRIGLMLSEQVSPSRRQSRDAARLGDPGLATDKQLLSSFVAHRDEAAFAAIVHRHGPLVLTVCRRILHNPHEVEDAFQATFLVLIRKAGTLRRPELLANWLYGVAFRISRKLRAGIDLRRHHESRRLHAIFASPDPANSNSDLGPILDEELERLPEKYRVAVVLCYLEGMTNEEAARQLQWPTGTVKGRLARARDLLRSRLVRRGVTLSAALLAIGSSENGVQAAELSQSLVNQTVQGGLNGRTSPLATNLAELYLRQHRSTWVLSTLLTGAAVLTAAGALAVGLGHWLGKQSSGIVPAECPHIPGGAPIQGPADIRTLEVSATCGQEKPAP